jgi:hypothetical protein
MQLPLDLFDPGDATDRHATAALVRSIRAAAANGVLLASDEAAAYTALAIARELDSAIANHAAPDAIIRLTTSLRVWYGALNLTPAGRDRTARAKQANPDLEPPAPDAGELPDTWAEFGAATMGDAAES